MKSIHKRVLPEMSEAELNSRAPIPCEPDYCPPAGHDGHCNDRERAHTGAPGSMADHGGRTMASHARIAAMKAKLGG